MALSGCSTLAGQSGTATGTAGANCQTAQLTLGEAGDESGDGNFATVFELRNRVQQTCTLEGYPGVELLDASERPMTFAVEQETSAYLVNAQKPGLVTLAPGASSYFLLEWSAGPTSCPGTAFVLLTPPGDQTSLRIASVMEICSGPVIVSPIMESSPFR
jgi:hypothetical protein